MVRIDVETTMGVTMRAKLSKRAVMKEQGLRSVSPTEKTVTNKET